MFLMNGSSIRLVTIFIVIIQASCAEIRESRDYEKKRQEYEARGVTLPYKAPLPPVPIF